MSALTQMAQHVTDLYGIHCRFVCQSIVNVDDNKVATQLFRIAQEATTNAAKHGHAENITISLAEDNGIVTLSITDDGDGFILPDEPRHGMGIRSMYYRAGIIGGRLTIAGGDQGGTEVQCQIRLIESRSESPEPVNWPARTELESVGEGLQAPDQT